jgi:hypothetical protein
MEGIDEFEKLVKETILEYLGISAALQLGILQVAQWWHTSDPFGDNYGAVKIHQHVHGVVFDFGFDGTKIVPFTKMFVSDDKGFVRLRSLWRSKLKACYGDFEANDVDAFIRYAEGGGELNHRIRYMFRSPVQDVCGWVLGHGVPEEYDAGWAKQMLRGRGHAQRVHYYGWLAPVSQSPRSRFMRFLDLELLNRRCYDAERKKVICNKCGCMMTRVPGSVEDTDVLIARGERFLVYVPPWKEIGFENG